MNEPTPESVTIVLPLPSPYLHPNKAPRSRKGFIIKGRLTKERRALCKRLAEAQGLDSLPWPAARIDAHFLFATNRRRDLDGLGSWMKATLDGLADSGIVNNDADFTYPHITTDIDKDCPRLEVTITRQEKSQQAP